MIYLHKILPLLASPLILGHNLSFVRVHSFDQEEQV